MAHRLAPEAEADLDELWFYIASNGSVDAADRFVDALTTRFFLLATHTRAGRQRNDFSAGLRMFPVGDYVVLYRVEGDDVLIVRVVRGSQDLEPLFDEGL
jgi:toxin ParE1/3/4